jgi:RimJ/RimL family protein N-acetyltransferase
VSGDAAREWLVVARAGRVTLRRRVAADAIDEYRWNRDPDIARQHGQEPISRPFSDYLAEFERDIRIVDSTRDAFAIEIADGTHIGTAAFYGGNHALGTVEIGMTIGETAHQSKGLGREAAIAFLRYLFAERPFARIIMHALTWNERAIRCFAALGFTETGRVHRGEDVLVRMEVAREWWLLWDAEGRFDRYVQQPTAADRGQPGKPG